MGIFDFFGKKPKKDEVVCYDKLDYHYENAFKAYLQTNALTEESTITDEMDREIMKLAVNHIALMLMWIAERGFYNESEYEDDTAMLFEDIKIGELSAVEFFLDLCDGKLTSEDISLPIRPFMEEYYMTNYWNDYVKFIVDVVGDLPYEVNFTMKDYQDFAPTINQAYEAFLSR